MNPESWNLHVAERGHSQRFLHVVRKGDRITKYQLLAANSSGFCPEETWCDRSRANAGGAGYDLVDPSNPADVTFLALFNPPYS